MIPQLLISLWLWVYLICRTHHIGLWCLLSSGKIIWEIIKLRWEWDCIQWCQNFEIIIQAKVKTWWQRMNVQPGLAIECNVDVWSFITWYMRQKNLTKEMYIAVGRRQLIFLALIDGFTCTYVFYLSNQHLYKKVSDCTKRDMSNIQHFIVVNPMPNASSVHSWQLTILWMSVLPFSFHFYIWPCLHMQTHIKKTALEINFMHLDSKGCYCFFF